ncbi:VWA domain-containing protein [Terasakiella sp. A23]|uniref:nitric oxide reductase activation protein NorD n=1 Tax=Terasakiella sp. FCG-A23 TaxID=3080561 RepID=UPI0029535A78|nr:VWA domain-containing protein [Terasakiella sp. A23]MDV7339157.1 VWA domain-containing protein [Terasakiella sp. A23]
MSVLDVLEVEEFVGHQWDKIIGGAESYTSFPEAAITLEEVRGPLAVFFRTLGGLRGMEIAASKHETSKHRLSFRQKLGMAEEKTMRPTMDGQTLMLPQTIDTFPEVSLNRALYFWLAAYFASEDQTPPAYEEDPLKRDLLFLRRALRLQERIMEEMPGMRPVWTKLSQAFLMMRPKRSLPISERSLEEILQWMLGAAEPDANNYLAFVLGDDNVAIVPAPPQYRPFLPVPLWGEVIAPPTGGGRKGNEERGGNSSKNSKDNRKIRAQRRNLDQANRDDGFFLHIYDKIMSVADMLNVNRNTEDDDEDEASKTADDMDSITVGEHDKKAATKIKLDLDLPADEVETDRLIDERLVPEWDYKRQVYHPDHCSIQIRTATEEGEDWKPNEAAKRRIRRVKRQFEALQAKRETLRAQPDGEELDIEAVVRARADLKANGVSSNRIYTSTKIQSRDLAVSILVDVSLSTDSWLDNRRVIDVEKEALTILGNGLAACGDDFAIHTFTSRKRSYVRIDEIKGFDEKFNQTALRRISALKPGYYTRIGAAVRAISEDLAKRPNRQKLLLVITDGKPNDVDHYEGLYGIEDSRKAVSECKQMGVTIFGVTVDRQAQEYFPYIFGRGSYQIISHVSKLSTALPKIYRQLVRGS